MTGGPAVLAPVHAAAAAALHAACFRADAWSASAIAGLLGDPHVAGVALLDGEGAPEALALVRAAAGEAEVLTLCVRPDRRRRGAGRRVLAAAEAAARARGALVLFLEVSDRNAAARAMYAAAGYARAGLRLRYYADGSDAILLRKSLAGSGEMIA
jgi:ribosomal-protein-alanine N-acetyltransferase